MAVAVAHAADKGGEDHLRAHHTHREDRVVKHAIVAPLREGLFLRLRKSEVGLSAPEFLRAVIFVGLQQFVGADEAERVVALGGHARSARPRRA